MKFSVKNLFAKYDQIRSFLWIWSHLIYSTCERNLKHHTRNDFYK